MQISCRHKYKAQVVQILKQRLWWVKTGWRSSWGSFCYALSGFPLTPVTALREMVFTGSDGGRKQAKPESKWQIQLWPHENRKRDVKGSEERLWILHKSLQPLEGKVLTVKPWLFS